ncbi:MAG TPA: hypothetical protein G4N93_01045 [Dehalococcoidia bacterium]|nr:hypothetical protein [Dehalococcoidia bacterium]
MDTYTLQYKAKISKKQAISKISAHAMFGNHGNSFRPSSIQEVQKYFLQKGVNTDELAERFRNPHNFVPDFENLIRSTWHTSGGVGVSLVDSDGEVIHEMKEPGLFIWSSYEAHFEAACAARDRAVSEDSYPAFQECLSQGFASIEAFFNTRAKSWNKQNPEYKLVDSGTQKVSLEDKIDEWVPKISGGGKIDKTGQVWNDFKTLKKVRDDNAIHPKLPGHGISYKDFANQINAFRLGIAQLLGNIHRLLGIAVPGVIINVIYMPDVEVIRLSDNGHSK